MKIDYYYDGQFRRVLKHLIRVFGEFQVQNGIDANGNPKYKRFHVAMPIFQEWQQQL